MLTTALKYNYHFQAEIWEKPLIEKIKNSNWWLRTTKCVDNHFTSVDGVMLSDHLIAVTENIDNLFNRRHWPFMQKMFALLRQLGIDRNKLRQELKIVSLLHDMGKTEADKSKLVPHPVHGYHTIKRHGIVSVYAAIDLLEAEELLTYYERIRIYTVIEEHDVSYGLFREWMCTGITPKYGKWKYLNDKIDEKEGRGLMYLLFFKLADTHEHQNVSDVIWFFKEAGAKYFRKHEIDLPIPKESDVRL